MKDEVTSETEPGEVAESEWSGEELLDLEEATLSPDVLYLDPNNPRLLDAPIGDGQERIPDIVALDPLVQDGLVTRLRNEEEVQSLVTRIRSMGFVSSFERIVVRPSVEDAAKYLVLEGNRRVAAVKTILANRAQYLTLTDKVQESINAIQVVLYEGDDPDVAWQIQGFRNVGGGIKDWKPFQKARYIVDLLNRTGKEPAKVAELTGLSTSEVNKLVRSYHGYMQAMDDEEWGGALAVSDFAVFNEAIFSKRNTPLWGWLDWNESDKEFQSEEHLTELLRLLKERDDGGAARISRVNPDLRDYFQKLLEPGKEEILTDFQNGTLDLVAAYNRAIRQDAQVPEPEDLAGHVHRLSSAREHVLALPVLLIREQKREAEFGAALKALREATDSAVDELD